MRNSPSIPGLSGGRPHGRRDMAKDDRTIELRPVSSSSSESDDEETNRKLSDEVTQRSSLGHKRPTRDSISSYNKYCRPYLCSFRRSSHSNRQKLPSSTIPLSFEVPAYTLYFQKLESLAFIFVAANMGIPLFKFVYSGHQKTHRFCNRVRFGRSRSIRVIQGRWFWYQSKARIRLPISASLWLWSYLAPFLRYGDLLAKIAYFATPFSFGALAP